MQKIIGIVGLIAGVLLLIQGHNVVNSLNSQVKQIFTGSPTDRATYFYIAGAALIVFGVVQIFWKRK